jgi:hypothetical protein
MQINVLKQYMPNNINGIAFMSQDSGVTVILRKESNNAEIQEEVGRKVFKASDRFACGGEANKENSVWQNNTGA